MLAKIISFLKKPDKNYNEPITPELVDRISTLYAYRLMMRSGNYSDDNAYLSNRRQCREVLRFLCHLGYTALAK